MKRIKVTAGVLSVGAGVRVALAPAQSKPRAHNLIPVAGPGGDPIDGQFTASAVLHFKAGEVLGIDKAGIAKSQRDMVEDLDAPPAPAEAEARPAARRGR